MRRAENDLTERLRRRIVGGIHRGELRAGDRLSSSRAVADELHLDHRAVSKAYQRLAELGLVEVRPRSGVYVAEQRSLDTEGRVLSDTARWVGQVVTEAWLRHISPRELDEVMRRCLRTTELRAACIESARDPLEAICASLRDEFDLDTLPALTGPDVLDASTPTLAPAVVEAVAAADFVVTSAFHIGQVRAALREIDLPKPVVTMHLGGRWRSLLRRAAYDGGLLVIGVDSRSAERFRIALELDGDARFRFVTTAALSDHAPPAPDEGWTTYATLAARPEARALGIELPATSPPVLSLETANELADTIIRLNLASQPDGDGA